MKQSILRKHLFVFGLTVLTACGGGGSSSGVAVSSPGDNLPANFVGTYTGTITVTLDASVIDETRSYSITVTVNADATIRFEVAGIEESFTAGVTNAGQFSGNINFTDDDCDSAVIGVEGTVDGSTVTGTVTGNTECDVAGLPVDVDLRGNFSASK